MERILVSKTRSVLCTIHFPLSALAHGNESQYGWSALHHAAQHSNMELARLLLGRGADPECLTGKGERCLDLCKIDMQPALEDALLEESRWRRRGRSFLLFLYSSGMLSNLKSKSIQRTGHQRLRVEKETKFPGEFPSATRRCLSDLFIDIAIASYL